MLYDILIEHSYGRLWSLGFGLPLGMSREVEGLLIFGFPLGMSREVEGLLIFGLPLGMSREVEGL